MDREHPSIEIQLEIIERIMESNHKFYVYTSAVHEQPVKYEGMTMRYVYDNDREYLIERFINKDMSFDELLAYRSIR